MRQRINYGSDDYTGSVIIWIILIGCIFFFWWWPPVGNGWSWWWWVLLCILGFWWLCTLFYAPIGVDVDDDEVRIRRPLKSRHIRMDEIQSVEPYEVSKNASRKSFKSSPVRSFGHWGQYHDDKIGDYFAYYGKPDNTVLLTLKDGRKYVVGGSDARQLSEYINSKLNNN